MEGPDRLRQLGLKTQWNPGPHGWPSSLSAVLAEDLDGRDSWLADEGVAGDAPGGPSVKPVLPPGPPHAGCKEMGRGLGLDELAAAGAVVFGLLGGAQPARPNKTRRARRKVLACAEADTA
jgi:hypothetical protein